MSDQATPQPTPVGGWWMASDGKWYPPELHPSVRGTGAVTDPASTPSGSIPATVLDPAGTGATAPGDQDPGAVPHLSRWSETARVAAVAPATPSAAGVVTQPPDMLQAMGGAAGAAELVSVAQEAGGTPPAPVVPASGPHPPDGAPGSGGAPGVGEFTGASARKRRMRWR